MPRVGVPSIRLHIERSQDRSPLLDLDFNGQFKNESRDHAAPQQQAVVAVFGARMIVDCGAWGEAHAWATEIWTNSSLRDCAAAVGARRASGRPVSRKARCGGPPCPTGHRNLSSQERPAQEEGVWRVPGYLAAPLRRRAALLRGCRSTPRGRGTSVLTAWGGAATEGTVCFNDSRRLAGRPGVVVVP